MNKEVMKDERFLMEEEEDQGPFNEVYVWGGKK